MLKTKEAFVDKSVEDSQGVGLTPSPHDSVVPLDVVLSLVSCICSPCQEKVRQKLAGNVHILSAWREMTPAVLDKIVERVASDRNLAVEEIVYGGNRPSLVNARREIVKQARKQGFSFSKIGAALKRHHTSIMYLSRNGNLAL
jgi:hypothetical protein